MKILEYADCTDYFTDEVVMRVWIDGDVTLSMHVYDPESIEGSIECAKEIGVYDVNFADELYRMVFDEAIIEKRGYSMSSTVCGGRKAI